MPKIKFTKMHGLGNDFMVVDDFEQTHQLKPEQFRRWSNRKTGIGFDQLLWLKPIENDTARYEIFNADGQAAHQCGNGARCVAKYLWDRGLTDTRTMTVVTQIQTLQLNYQNDDHITVSMGRATPIDSNHSKIIRGQTVTGAWIELGNPHWVLLVKTIDLHLLTMIAQAAQKLFPEGINLSYVVSQDNASKKFYLQTYERGVGLTAACGSAACAAAVAFGERNQWITMNMQFGALKIKVDKNNWVQMIGSARTIYQGSCEF